MDIYTQRPVAANLYLKYGRRDISVVRALGIPIALYIKYVQEFDFLGDLCKNCKRISKLSEAEKQRSLQYYQEYGRSIVVVIHALGSPSKSIFKRWLN